MFASISLAFGYLIGRHSDAISSTYHMHERWILQTVEWLDSANGVDFVTLLVSLFLSLSLGLYQSRGAPSVYSSVSLSMLEWLVR